MTLPKAKNTPLVRLATMFGIGNVKTAPGTFGSAAAMILAYPILQLPLGWIALFAGAIILAILGTNASHAYMEAHRIKEEKVIHDPKHIVVDEWAGQWLTYSVFHLWLLGIAGDAAAGNALVQTMGGAPHYLLFGFVLFRFFDIFKPWPIGLADRRIKGGFGVMFDDLLAALFAGTVLFAIHLFGPLISGQMLESQV